VLCDARGCFTGEGRTFNGRTELLIQLFIKNFLCQMLSCNIEVVNVGSEPKKLY